MLNIIMLIVVMLSVVVSLNNILLSMIGYYALFNNLIDLFLAGMETTSSSLVSILYNFLWTQVANFRNKLECCHWQAFPA
jgi:hypothetical protein